MKEIKQSLPPVRGKYKFDEPLRKYTWLNVGGPAEVMFFPQDEADLQFFLRHKPQNMPVFILGGGSNLLVRDGGISGVVIKLDAPEFSSWRLENNLLTAGSGLKNAQLKKILLAECIGGLEFICSIPGSIGGLLRSNAGCFGSEVSKVLLKARVMNGHGEIFEVQPEDFNFSYRESRFPEDWIILQVSFKTEKMPAEKIKEIIEKNAAYRKEHQPQNVRTAGSTFKNPLNGRAWEFIKNAGGDRLKIGGASFSEKHCNFMLNDGSATAADLETLGQKVHDMVKAQTGVDLQWEVKVIGKQHGND
ncbi:MAG: UDP-N-acetylmuramate dehydrogenase [Pseudomonadota bacterium]|nr:UDP-N-acetylmuramate dehydrogenase [Pseudomonadota bacterium]